MELILPHHFHVSATWLGIFTSFVASLLYLVFALCTAFYLRQRRANPFVGVYTMHDPTPPHARRDPDGRVNVEHERRFWDTDTTAKLKVYARGAADRPDWEGTLEVRGLSDVATGFYLHPGLAGGFLQFTRVGEDIMEQAQPHDPEHEKFQRLLRRVPSQKGGFGTLTTFWAALNLAGLSLSVLGGVLLFCSLTATSSNYRLVEKSDHGVAICLNDKLVATGFGGPIILSDEPCPTGKGPSVASVVAAERPVFVPWGFGLIFVGFALQVPAAFVACFKRSRHLAEVKR